METLNYLASLWGFSLVIVGLAFLVRPKQAEYVATLAADKARMMLCGVGLVALGVASLLAYNVWQWRWDLLVTLLGWLTLIKGAALLFLPDRVARMYEKYAPKKNVMKWASLAGVILGCALLYFGFAY